MRAEQQHRLSRLFWQGNDSGLQAKEESHPVADGFLLAAVREVDGERLWLCNANRDAIALERNGEVDGVYIGADDGHEVGFGRGDVDFAGWRAVGDGDVTGVAVDVGRGTCDGTDWDGDRRRDRVGGEVDDRDGAVAERLGGGGRGAGQVGIAAVDDVGAAVVCILEDANHTGVDTYGNGCENGAEAHRVDWIVGIAVGIGG